MWQLFLVIIHYMLDTKPVFNISEAKQKDIIAFNNWKETGSQEALGALMKQLHPVIYSQVERVSGTLPKAALSAEAKKWTFKAIESYDPTRGASLSTHVLNFLPKVRRLNYKYQNSARLPENLQLQYSNFQGAVSHLQETLGREPLDEEIAKKLGWSKPLVVRFKGSLYDDLVESVSLRPSEVSQFNENKFLLDHIMSKLNEQEKYILLESPDVTAQEAADHLGVNLSRWNYLKSKLIDKIMAMKAEIKMY
jgi:DNA-directed RNA polymerase specialized sigma subunit